MFRNKINLLAAVSLCVLSISISCISLCEQSYINIEVGVPQESFPVWGINSSHLAGRYSYLSGFTLYDFLMKKIVLEARSNMIVAISGRTFNTIYRVGGNREVLAAKKHDDQNGGSRYTSLLGSYIISPQPDELWIAGETDTIRWGGILPPRLLNIEFSIDNGINFSLIHSAVPSDSESYIWNIPDTVLSSKVKV